MIKFREKIFFLQAAMAIGTVASVPLTAMQISQGNEQAEQAEQQAKEQARAMNKQTAAINNLAKQNPAAAQAISGDIKSYSEMESVLKGIKTKTFAAPGTLSKVWDTAKNVWKANPKLAEQAKFGLGMGAVMGTGAYVTGKIISNDAEKNGIDLKAATEMNKQMASQQRAYSILDRRYFADVASQTGESILGKAGKLAGKVGSGISGQALNVPFAAWSGFGDWNSYKAEQNALRGMTIQSQYMKKAQQPQQRMHSVLQKQFGIGAFASRLGNKVLSMGGNFMGAGGTRHVANAGKKLMDTAGSNNIQHAVGEFMYNHNKISTGVGLAVGGGVIFDGANKLGEMAVKAPTKLIDSKAYDWQNYQNSKMEQ